MQVDRVDRDSRLRREPTHVRNMPFGQIPKRKDRQVKLTSDEQLLSAAAEAPIGGHAAAIEQSLVALSAGAVLRDESHVPARLLQKGDRVEHPLGAALLVEF